MATDIVKNGLELVIDWRTHEYVPVPLNLATKIY